MANQTQATSRDVRTYFLTEERLQKRHFLIEAGAIPNGDTIQVTHPDFADEGGFPMVSCNVFTHDGGMSTPATATHVTSNGDTIVFEFRYPEKDNVLLNSESTTSYKTLTHVLAGVTGGAATPAQITASLNADTAFRAYGYAAVTASNVVTVFPVGPNSHVKIGVGSTSVVAGTFGLAITNDVRTYTQKDPSSWLATHNTSTGVVTLTNGSGSTAYKVVAVVSYF